MLLFRRAKVGMHVNRLHWSRSQSNVWGHRRGRREGGSDSFNIATFCLGKEQVVLFANAWRTKWQAGRRFWRRMNEATPPAPREMRLGFASETERVPAFGLQMFPHMRLTCSVRASRMSCVSTSASAKLTPTPPHPTLPHPTPPYPRSSVVAV